MDRLTLRCAIVTQQAANLNVWEWVRRWVRRE